MNIKTVKIFYRNRPGFCSIADEIDRAIADFESQYRTDTWKIVEKHYDIISVSEHEHYLFVHLYFTTIS